MKKKIDNVPGYLKELKKDGENIIKDFEKLGFKIEDVAKDSINAVKNMAEEGLKFEEDQGKKWKKNCESMLNTVNEVVGNLQKIDSNIPLVDDGTAKMLTSFSTKGKAIVKQIPDTIAGPLGIIDDVLLVDHFTAVFDQAVTAIKDTVSYINASSSTNNTPPIPMAKVASTSSSGISQDRTVVVSAILASTIAASAIKEIVDYVINTAPLTVKFGINGGIALLLNIDQNTEIDTISISSAILGPLSGFCSFILTLLGNLQTFLLNFIN